MATGFVFSEDNTSSSVLNDSGTTAITAGDVVYCATNDNVFVTTTTLASGKGSYAVGDVKGKSMAWSATGYQTLVGVAKTDIAADGYGSVYLSGLFFHATNDNIEAGDMVCGATTTKNRVQTVTDNGTTTLLTKGNFVVGRALTGGSTGGEYVLWKLH